MCTNVRRRAGFTLIEMLVVLGIILVLATLGVVFYPRLQDSNNMIRASDLVSQTLGNARTRAKRDNLPTGVRFEYDPATGYVTQMEYIQQPDNYSVGICRGTLQPIAGTNPPQYDTVTFATDPRNPAAIVNFRGAGSALNAADQATIQPGDYLEVFGGGGVHRIGRALTTTSLQLLQPVTIPIAQTSNYRIIRQPRIVIGEDPITLPKNMVLDFKLVKYPNTVPVRQVPIITGTTPPTSFASFYEILFSPSGSVIGQGTGSDKIILWLRDLSQPSPEAPDPYAGSPVLISVQVRTGFIAVNPVGPPNDPFRYTRDPRSSGL